MTSRRRQNFRWEDLPESENVEDRTAPDYVAPPPPTMAEMTERADQDRKTYGRPREDDLSRALGGDDLAPGRGGGGVVLGLLRLVALLTGGRR